jgi:hypothetical protein
MLRGVSSVSSVCQLSQSNRLQWSIRRFDPFSISTVAIAAWRQERQREGSKSRTMRSFVFSFCIGSFLDYSIVLFNCRRALSIIYGVQASLPKIRASSVPASCMPYWASRSDKIGPRLQTVSPLIRPTASSSEVAQNSRDRACFRT